MPNLEDRVTALENQMTETRQIAGEARLLSSGAHEESGDVKAVLASHTRVINGWGTQINARIDALEGTVSGLNTHVKNIDGRLANLETKVDAGHSVINNKLDELLRRMNPEQD